jgi:hypothetical protein
MQGDILKKGQVQITETLLVLVVFTVLLLIALIVFYKFNITSITSDMNRYEDIKFRYLISTIPSMSEFRCSNLGNDQECIDLDKVFIFKNIVGTDYNKIFGYKNITLSMIYPMEDNVYNIYSNKPKITKTTKKISTFVSVYDSSQDKYKIGKLVIEAYS